MFNGIKQYLFLVVDQETAGVITKCSTASIANAVSKGIINSSTMVIHFPYMTTKHDINQYQDDFRLNYKIVRAYKSKVSNMVPPVGEGDVYEIVDSVPSGKTFDLRKIESITPEWIEKRKLGNFRAAKIRSLEMICERYLARLKNFTSDDAFLQYFSTQISLVDEKNNYYPPSIIEWANISNVTPQTAYQELKLNYDSIGIAMMRMHAIWNKYVDKFNQIDSEEEFEEKNLFLDLEVEIKFGQK